MFDIDRWQEIFFSIRQNKLRTFLSGFTITLGLFIFIFLFGIGNGLQNGFAINFIQDAANLITVVPGKTSQPFRGLQENRNIELKNEDLEIIKQQYGEKLEFKTSMISRSQRVVKGSETGNYTVEGTYPEKQYIAKAKIMRGRFINMADLDKKLKYAVIGRLVERDLFKRESALGKYLTISGSSYKVIGVFTDEGGDNEERVIYIPLTTMQSVNKGTMNVDQIDLGYYSSMAPKDVVKLGADIERNLQTKLQISPTDKSALYIRNSADKMNETVSFLGVISILVVFIGFGTITAGVIGISNIMVYIVKERTKEIGVRKALGARPYNIVSLILQESIFITVISGILGVVLGVLGLHLIKDSLKDYFIINPSVSWNLIFIATFCLITFGTIAGFIPARKAAKIKPIEALRSE